MLGRRTPGDFKHVEKYRYSAGRTVDSVEKAFRLPPWHPTHDQGYEGSCVGHGAAIERAITNTRQNVLGALPWPRVRRYNPIQIWNAAKTIDEWDDTNPGDDNGTSVRAGYDALRLLGAQRVKGMKLSADGRPYPVWPEGGEYPVDIAEGILANRWATTVDEIRTAIAAGSPVTIGVNWYASFWPEFLVAKGNRREWWLSDTTTSLSGGHCVCIYAASDKRQGFRFKNSWGRDYPETWISYSLMQRLLDEDGEAVLITDK